LLKPTVSTNAKKTFANLATNSKQPTTTSKTAKKKKNTAIKHGIAISQYESMKPVVVTPTPPFVPFQSLKKDYHAALPQRKRKNKSAKKLKEKADVTAADVVKVMVDSELAKETKPFEKVKAGIERKAGEKANVVDSVEVHEEINLGSDVGINPAEPVEVVVPEQDEGKFADLQIAVCFGPEPALKQIDRLFLSTAVKASTLRDLVNTLARHGTVRVIEFILAQDVEISVKGSALTMVSTLLVQPSSSIFGILFPLQGRVGPHKLRAWSNNTYTQTTKRRLQRPTHAIGEDPRGNSDGDFSISKFLGFEYGQDREPSYPRPSESIATTAIADTVALASVIAAELAPGLVFRNGMVMTVQYAAKLDAPVAGPHSEKPVVSEPITQKAANLESLSIAEALDRSFGLAKKPLVATATPKGKPAIAITEGVALQEERCLDQVEHMKKPERFDLSRLTRQTKQDVVKKTVIDCISVSSTDTVENWIMSPYIGGGMRSSLLSALMGLPRRDVEALSQASPLITLPRVCAKSPQSLQIRIQKRRRSARWILESLQPLAKACAARRRRRYQTPS